MEEQERKLNKLINTMGDSELKEVLSVKSVFKTDPLIRGYFKTPRASIASAYSLLIRIPLGFMKLTSRINKKTLKNLFSVIIWIEHYILV